MYLDKLSRTNAVPKFTYRGMNDQKINEKVNMGVVGRTQETAMSLAFGRFSQAMAIDPKDDYLGRFGKAVRVTGAVVGIITNIPKAIAGSLLGIPLEMAFQSAHKAAGVHIGREAGADAEDR